MSDHSRRSPRSDAAAREAFQALVPDDPRVTVRPMFGSVAAFVDGNMFCGLFADEFFVRLSEADRHALLAQGARPLEPMPGRPMREYVVLDGWRSRPADIAHWTARALDYATSLPAKKVR